MKYVEMGDIGILICNLFASFITCQNCWVGRFNDSREVTRFVIWGHQASQGSGEGT